MDTFLAFLLALPKLLDVLSGVIEYAKARELKGIGRREAVAEGLQLTVEQLAKVSRAEREATAEHAAHPDDDAGFLMDFQRDQNP